MLCCVIVLYRNIVLFDCAVLLNVSICRMAPEVLMGKPFDASSDVYSFGVVLWEMLTKEEVYPEFTSFGAFKVWNNNNKQ
jgi:serine/threonine protein kinase